ncbi:MAG: siderophore-interacting protein [Acidimicrobiales bacterium]
MTTVRTRREPPVFRRVEVARVEPRTPRLLGLTLTGPELEGLDIGLPAASVRLYVPPAEATPPAAAGAPGLVLPTWDGNEFLAADGTRPAIRTLTPVRFDADALELDVEVVLHGPGPLSTWAAAAGSGSVAAVSGTGRGYTVDPSARELLVAGDESALPAIGVLLDALPTEAAVRVIVEIAAPEARLDLPRHPGLTEQWVPATAGAPPGDALVAAVAATEIGPDTRVWVAGEAAAVWRIRRRLFDDLGLPRSHAVVRGYWKVGRGGDPDDS